MADKNFSPMLSSKSIFMSEVDSLAGYFGGMTDHTVGDYLLDISLKNTLVAYNVSTKIIRSLNDKAENTIKKDLILARRRSEERQRA